MRIGILTFWDTEDNYGQVLQNYALQQYLQSLKHETFLIRAVSEKDFKKPSLKDNLFAMMRAFSRLYKWPFYCINYFVWALVNMSKFGKFEVKQEDRQFETFRKQYLNCSALYTLKDLETNPPKADAFIVGSDQIWNSTDGIYFLSWAKDEVKKISYSASFGAREANGVFYSIIKPWLRRFDAISVREQEGLNICQKAGREDAVCVVDPTLLLSYEDYKRIASYRLAPHEKYIFVYFLGTRTIINWKEIFCFAQKNKLKIVYVGAQGQIDKYDKLFPTVEEWIGLIEHADYVITNSFHGTVFSLIFEKKFTTIPIAGSLATMNNRIETLLQPLNLLSRVGNLDFESLIDYNNIRKELLFQIKQSKYFLSFYLDEYIV